MIGVDGSPNEELKRLFVRRRNINFLTMHIYYPKVFVTSSPSEIESLVYPSLPFSDFNQPCFNINRSGTELIAAVEGPPDLKLYSLSDKLGIYTWLPHLFETLPNSRV